MSTFIITIELDDEQSEVQQVASICYALQQLQQDTVRWHAPIASKRLHSKDGKVIGWAAIEEEEEDEIPWN